MKKQEFCPIFENMMSSPEKTRTTAVILKEPSATEGSHDRLAHAKKFADLLSESRLREIAKAYRKRWTPAARARKKQIIQSVKPWLRSTGPKCGRKADPDKPLKEALRYQQQFLRAAVLLDDMAKRGWDGPELANLRQYCLQMGCRAMAMLGAAHHVTERNNE